MLVTVPQAGGDLQFEDHAPAPPRPPPPDTPPAGVSATGPGTRLPPASGQAQAQSRGEAAPDLTRAGGPGPRGSGGLTLKQRRRRKEAWKRQGPADGKGGPTRPCVLSVWLQEAAPPPSPLPQRAVGARPAAPSPGTVVRASPPGGRVLTGGARNTGAHSSILRGAPCGPQRRRGKRRGWGRHQGRHLWGRAGQWAACDTRWGGRGVQPGPISRQGARASWNRAWRGSSVLSGGQYPVSFHALHAGGQGPPNAPCACLSAVNRCAPQATGTTRTPASRPNSRAPPGGSLTWRHRARGQGLVSGLCSPLWPSRRHMHTLRTHTAHTHPP